MLMSPTFIDQDSTDKQVIYILDDQREIGMLLCRMLDAIGYIGLAFSEVDACLNELARAQAQTQEYAKPKCLILDLALKKTDAIDVFDKLKKINYKGRILLMSGSDDGTLREIQKMGAARGYVMLPYLRKPFRINDLKEKIKAEPDRLGEQSIGKEHLNGLLEKALMDNKLTLRYEKRYDLKSGVLSGAEAVAHTYHPSYGDILAEDYFLPHESSLGFPYMRFATRQMLADWSSCFASQKNPFKLSTQVPLSVISMARMIVLLREAIPSDPRFPGLTFDIVDWSTYKNNHIIQQVGAQLNLYNIGLSVNDVGALYGSIPSNENFPFKELKLKSDFVRSALFDATVRKICADTISLAHRMGATVCIRGISNRDEVQALTEMGCDFMQTGRAEPIDHFKQKPASMQQPQAMAGSDVSSDPFAWPAAR
jgi:EAL domain-containing protein (putative c-di-GMP-specific phosphodiesterase class I)